MLDRSGSLMKLHFKLERLMINPQCACAARVTVVGSAYLCVCLLTHISPMERLFVLKTLSCTQQATKVKNFVGICLKRLPSRTHGNTVSVINVEISPLQSHLCTQTMPS